MIEIFYNTTIQMAVDRCYYWMNYIIVVLTKQIAPRQGYEYKILHLNDLQNQQILL